MSNAFFEHYQPTDFIPILDAHVDRLRGRYPAASAAANELSPWRHPLKALFRLVGVQAVVPQSVPTQAILRGRKMRKKLKKMPPQSLLLHSSEIDSLRQSPSLPKHLMAFDTEILSPLEQASRVRINECVASMIKDPQNDEPYTPLWDPQKIREIEKLMQEDPTAQFLSSCVKHNKVPVILCAYDFPAKLPPDHVRGNYCYKYSGNEQDGKNLTKDLDFIALYADGSTDVPELTRIYSHEARHFWHTTEMSPSELVPYKKGVDSPINKILSQLICEADSVAIDRKVRWNMTRLLPSVFPPTSETIAFNNDYLRCRSAGLTPEQSIKKAMQAIFIDFLKNELANPNYLKKFVGKTGMDGRSQTWKREIAGNKYIGDRFLKRITTVPLTTRPADDSPYLDATGIKQVQVMIVQNLPLAIYQTAKLIASAPRP
jgi:hypothetical protein